MTIILSGLTLNKEMVWSDRFTASGIAISYRKTIGGRVVSLPSAKIQRPVTLIAQEDHGWLTRTQVEALITMAMVPDGQYELSYYGTIVPVRFDNENPPAVDMQPLILAANPSADAYFAGTIKLITL